MGILQKERKWIEMGLSPEGPREGPAALAPHKLSLLTAMEIPGQATRRQRRGQILNLLGLQRELGAVVLVFWGHLIAGSHQDSHSHLLLRP